MAFPTSTDSIELFFQHLATLKEYAERVLIGGEIIDEREDADKLYRMQELFDIGGSFDLTEKDMVTILYREHLMESNVPLNVLSRRLSLTLKTSESSYESSDSFNSGRLRHEYAVMGML